MRIERGIAGRIRTAAVSVAVVAGVVAGMLIVSGAGSPAVALQQTGHWVLNRAESSVVHVDSGTRQVDARVLVPGAGADPAFAVQGDRQGFLVSRKSITVFGKATLTVDATLPSGQTEMPVGIEVVGGPYLVYRDAGTIVRLGLPPLSIQIGGRVGRPVSTDDGTVWLHRLDNAALCALRRGADALDCSLQTAEGAPGALTVTSTTPAFLDTAQDAVQGIEATSLRAPVPIGTDLPNEALIADRDTRGRLPVVAAAPNRLLLTDTSGVPLGHAGGPPIAVDLGDGQFTSPVAAGGVVAVIDQAHNRLLTFGIDGRPLGSVDLPPGEGPASVTRGEDGRIYVDDADGAVTHVVGADGTVTSVRTGGVVTAVVAAPPEQASLIPPPRRGPTLPGPGSSPDQPGNQPVTLPNPPSSAPTAPIDPVPPAPTGLKAVAAADGSVAVGWNAVKGAGMRYSVQVDGSPAAQSPGTTASVTGLTAGQRYSVTVSAINAAGQGPESGAVTVTPFRAAASPLNARIAVHEAGGRVQDSLFWDAPDLGGGVLVGYQVTGPGGKAGPVDELVVPQGAAPLQFNEFDTYCGNTISYQVRAITTPPGGGPRTKGAVASASTQISRDCSLQLFLDSAAATGPTTATVTFHCSGNGTGDVTLTADGVSQQPGSGGTVSQGRWTGTCAGGQQPTTATLTGLSPSTPLSPGSPGLRYTTTYTVTGSVSSASGTKAAPSSVSFSMPGN